MALTVDWQQDGQQATIRQGGLLTARLLGLPVLAAGVYFGSFFVRGLISPGGLTIAGWILLPLMTSVALVPGWIMVFGRKRTRLDSARREVVEEMDYLVYTYRKTLKLTNDSHVRLRFERGSKSSYDIHVDAVTGDKDALLALFNDDQKSEALALGAKAAAFLGVSMQDRMVEDGYVTSGGVVVSELEPGEADPEDDDEEEELEEEEEEKEARH